MSISINRRSVMTLFSGENDIYSHQVRLMLKIKDISADIIYLSEKDNIPEKIIEYNPYGNIPVLVDREVSLYHPRIILEYLDERFPYPPMMPVYPVLKANLRLKMHRIESDYFSLVSLIEEKGSKKRAPRKQLLEELLAIAPAFSKQEFFLSDECTIVDIYLMTMLWRFKYYEIELTGKGSQDILNYMSRMYAQDVFKESLTEQEEEIGFSEFL